MLYPIKMKAGNAPSLLLLPIKARSVLSVFPIIIKLLIAYLKLSNQIKSLGLLQHISSWFGYLGQNKLTTDLPTCFVPVSTEDSHIVLFERNNVFSLNR
jgi:hypothetical protein